MGTRVWRFVLCRLDPTLSPKDRELLKTVETRVALQDAIAYVDPGFYFHTGLSAVRCIDSVLEAAETRTVKSVLDFPSGYGRVLRFLVRRFPGARFGAGEIDRDAVDFCARLFGTSRIYSATDFRTVEVTETFDLMWCGSLFTHLNGSGLIELLRFFHRVSSESGVLVFSTGGERAATALRNQRSHGLTPHGRAQALSDYAATGFGYADYVGSTGYGMCLMSPDWVRAQLIRSGGWREVHFGAAEWNDHQDIFGVVKET